MRVEIWSDVVCPFCYIGKRKLELALDAFEYKEQVTIEWKSYQLDPEMDNWEGLTVHEYLGKRKGGTPADGKRMNDQMADVAKEVGLEFNFNKAVINNTLNAHRLLHYAKKHGVQNELKERLFKAFYTEGMDVSNAEVLTSLAQEIGLNQNEVHNLLNSNLMASEVTQDQQEAYQGGVQGVPFFVFNNKYAVSGAQSPAVFLQVLQKVWQEDKPLLVSEAEGEHCDINGNC